MSHQLTFADSEFSSKAPSDQKEIFLSRMEQILPWQNMVEVIEPFFKAGNGRRPYPLETMLRISLHAALVQPERWRDGRCLYGNRLHASVCPVIPG